MFIKSYRLLGAAVLTLSLAVCDDEVPPGTGDLHVEFRVGSGSQNCDEANINFIRVDVMASETNSIAEMTVACDPDDQSVIFEDIEEGTYDLRVQGLNGDNALIFNGTSSAPVEVVPDQTNGPVTVVIEQLRPSLLVWFGFAEVGGCERFEVMDIAVLVYEDGSSVIYNELFDCSERMEDGLLIEDLSESATYDIRIRGTNENGEYTFEFNTDEETVTAGPPTEILAELIDCGGVCEAP